MVRAERDDQTTTDCLVIEPNNSLTWRQSMAFFFGITVVSLSIAWVFALLGYWMIFPFAGLELLALGAALYVAAQAARRRQVITVSPEEVRVEKGRVRRMGSVAGGPEYSDAFPRGWTRVELQRTNCSWYPPRLWVAACGRRVEIGEFLPEDEREQLAVRLERLLIR